MSSRVRFVSFARVTVAMAVMILALVALASASVYGQEADASASGAKSTGDTSPASHAASSHGSTNTSSLASHAASSHSSTNTSSLAPHAASSHSSTATTTTTTTTAPTTSTSTTTVKPTEPATPKPPIDNDVDDGMSTFVFVVIILFIIGAILYGSRAVPRTCPFFRGASTGTGGAGGAGGVGRRGAAPRTQQYARLDGGAFYGDEEDYRGMEPSSAAAGALRPYSPLRGGAVEGDGRGDVVVEMQEKLKSDAGVAPAMGRVSASGKPAFLPRESAVQASGVVDHNPAALDALFGTTAASTPTTSPAPIPLASKNSLKAMRKGKLGHAVSSTPFGATKAGSSASGSQHRDNWEWSSEDKEK